MAKAQELIIFALPVISLACSRCLLCPKYSGTTCRAQRSGQLGLPSRQPPQTAVQSQATSVHMQLACSAKMPDGAFCLTPQWGMMRLPCGAIPEGRRRFTLDPLHATSPFPIQHRPHAGSVPGTEYARSPAPFVALQLVVTYPELPLHFLKFGCVLFFLNSSPAILVYGWSELNLAAAVLWVSQFIGLNHPAIYDW